MRGQSSAHLQQHARSAFHASEMLLRQAENAGGGTERFYRAANRYATTLRALGGSLSGAGTPATTGAGGDFMNGFDLTTVSLINHGVKEALDSLQLKQMVRMMGGETEAGRALMDHARQMDAESRQAIDALATVDGSIRPDATGAGGRVPNPTDAGATAPGTTAGVRPGGTLSVGSAPITPGGAAATGGVASAPVGGVAGAGGGMTGAIGSLVENRNNK